MFRIKNANEIGNDNDIIIRGENFQKPHYMNFNFQTNLKLLNT